MSGRNIIVLARVMSDYIHFPYNFGLAMNTFFFAGEFCVVAIRIKASLNRSTLYLTLIRRSHFCIDLSISIKHHEVNLMLCYRMQMSYHVVCNASSHHCSLFISVLLRNEYFVIFPFCDALLLLKYSFLYSIISSGPRYSSDASRVFATTPLWMTLANAKHFMAFAMASYGWPLVCYMHCCTGPARLLKLSTCCACFR